MAAKQDALRALDLLKKKSTAAEQAQALRALDTLKRRAEAPASGTGSGRGDGPRWGPSIADRAEGETLSGEASLPASGAGKGRVLSGESGLGASWHPTRVDVMEPVQRQQQIAVSGASDRTLEAWAGTLREKSAAADERVLNAGGLLPVDEADRERAGGEARRWRSMLDAVTAEQQRRKDTAFYDGLDRKAAELEKVMESPSFRRVAENGKDDWGHGTVSQVLNGLQLLDELEGLKGQNTSGAYTRMAELGTALSGIERAYKVSGMTEDERDVVRYYAARKRYGEAEEYLDAIRRRVNQRAAERAGEAVSAFAGEAPALGAAANIATWPGSIPAYAATAGQAVKNRVTGEYEPADVNSGWYAGARFSAATAQGTAEAARSWGKETFGSDTAGDVAAFLTQTGLSIGQNAAQIATLGPLSLAGMSLSAAGMAATEALDRGATTEQAFLVGTASGAVEAITEKLPLDNLFQIVERGGTRTAREAVVDVLRQMGTEASEEMISEIAGNMVDAAVMGDKAEYRQFVEQLVSQGVSREEAEKRAFLQFYVYNVLQAGAGGALSGGVMAGGATALGYAGYYADMLQAGRDGGMTEQNGGEAGSAAGELRAARPGDADTAETAVQQQSVERSDLDEQGERVSDGGPERDSGTGAREQIGQLEQGAEAAKAASQQSRTAIQRQAQAKAAGWERVDLRSLGVTEAVEGASVIRVEAGGFDSELKQAAFHVYQATGRGVDFVLGGIRVKTGDGGERLARGFYRPGQNILVQADHLSVTAGQLASHEIFHDLAARQPELVNDARNRIVERYGADGLNQVLDLYVDSLRGVVEMDGDAAGAGVEAALEEVLADAYAGINAFGAGAPRFQETLGQALEARGLGELAAEDAPRQPVNLVDLLQGERYSIGYDEDNRPFVEVDQDILAGVPQSQWVRTVKDNLRQKFPNGVTVGNNVININNQSRREMTYSRYMQKLAQTDPQAYADKLRATDNADELLSASRDWVNEALFHPKKDAVKDFARGTVQIRVGTNDYTAQVIVGNRGDGNLILYDIIGLEPAAIHAKSRTDPAYITKPTNGTGDRQAESAHTGSIAQQNGKVKSGPVNLVDLLQGERGGPRYSLNEFEDGQRFVDVQTGQRQFDGLSERELGRLATKIIKENFVGKVIGTDNRVFVNGRSAAEYGFPVKHLPADLHEAKMRASTELDNLLDAGTNFRTKPDGADGHTHSNATGDFSYFDTIFKVGSEYYKGTVNIASTEKGMLLKDVTQIENVTQAISSSYGQNPKSTILRDVSMETIAQRDGKVKSGPVDLVDLLQGGRNVRYSVDDAGDEAEARRQRDELTDRVFGFRRAETVDGGGTDGAQGQPDGGRVLSGETSIPSSGAAGGRVSGDTFSPASGAVGGRVLSGETSLPSPGAVDPVLTNGGPGKAPFSFSGERTSRGADEPGRLRHGEGVGAREDVPLRSGRTSAPSDGKDVPPATRQESAAETKGAKDEPSKPVLAKKDLRRNMLELFSIPDGRKKALGDMVERFGDRVLKNGAVTEEDRERFFDAMYREGVVEIARDQYFQIGREAVRGGKVYVDEKTRGEFGDDWNDFRKRAFNAQVYITGNREDSHVDQWNAELADSLPGLFRADELDNRAILERIVQAAEEGKAEKMSLAAYTASLVGDQASSEDEVLDGLERQMDYFLRSFAEKAGLEVKLRDRAKRAAARERERRKEQALRRAEDRALSELQQKTLKSLQWLSKNRNRAPADLKAAFDEVLGDIDLFAVSAAKETRWSKRYQATWGDLAEIYRDAAKNDPNFLEGTGSELKRIVDRLDKDKLADMDVGALQDLYKAAVGLRTELYNRKNLVADQEHRIFSEVFEDCVGELEGAKGGWSGNAASQYADWLLTPMNRLEKMAGWAPDSTFMSMARQFEEGERKVRDYQVRARRYLDGFIRENKKWLKTADGQGRTEIVRTAAEAEKAAKNGRGVWYEVEVPELVELRMGDKPVFGETVKVYMTPLQKVQLYLESKCDDNLRHMEGGRNFVDRELYSQGRKTEAVAQGKTIRLAPETVRALVSELTDQERALAGVLEQYYNEFSRDEINRVSNLLYGFDKAMSSYYAPIITEKAFLKSTTGVYELTAEGAGHLKGRVPYAKAPSRNMSALDVFDLHIDQTSYWCGMSVPTKNWDTLLSWQGDGKSMKSVIGHKWGGEGVKFIEELKQELQGKPFGKKKGLVDRLGDGALSRYITSVFGANPGVMLKQVMSAPLAATYLGWTTAPNLVEALRTPDTLINTYTSELAYRLLGYATPETAQLTKNRSALDDNKAIDVLFRGGGITAVDGATVKTLWRWAENAVRRDSKDLEVGDQETIDAGLSPFYREVARRFEEAVSRSQPMYDVMHRSDAMRSEGALTKALTLFKTVPLQQYNMLRQTMGEASAALRAYNAKKLGRDEYVKARRRAGSALGGIILASLGIEGVNLLAALAKGRRDRYEDEDGKLDWSKVGLQVLAGMGKDNLGMLPGGDAAFDWTGSALTGDRWYGVEAPGITQFNDLLSDLAAFGKKSSAMIAGGLDVVQNGGDLGAYLKRNGPDYVGMVKDAAVTLSTYLGGVPVNNLEAYIMGVAGQIFPEARVAYEDLLSTADRQGLKGLHGDALETRVGDILVSRAGETEAGLVEALSGLYEAGYANAIPAGTPDSATVNSEKRELSAFQKQCYDNVWKDAVGGELGRIASLDAFRNAGADAQARMLQKLYDFGGQRAKQSLFDDFSPDAWVDECARDPEGAAHWIAWHVLSEKEKGGGESGEREYQPTAFDKFTGAGLSDENALKAVRKIQGLQPLEGAKSVTAAQKALAVAGLGLGSRDTDAAVGTVLGDTALGKYQDVREAGIDPVVYLNFVIQYNAFASDRDEDGKEIKGQTRKDKVVNAIDALGISDEQKDALFLTEYRESGLGDAPWH